MFKISGRSLAVSAFLVVSVIAFFLSIEPMPKSPINLADLNKIGIKEVDVDYSNGKIYLNIRVISPKTCNEVNELLKIQPIVIKYRVYHPTCVSVSDTLMRITYTQQTAL